MSCILFAAFSILGYGNDCRNKIVSLWLCFRACLFARGDNSYKLKIILDSVAVCTVLSMLTVTSRCTEIKIFQQVCQPKTGHVS